MKQYVWRTNSGFHSYNVQQVDYNGRFAPSAGLRVIGNADGSLTLDRIFVPVALRRQGLATQTLKEVVQMADKKGKTLRATVYADWGTNNLERERINESLRRVLMKLGFRPTVFGGKVYPNTLLRYPTQNER